MIDPPPYRNATASLVLLYTDAFAMVKSSNLRCGVAVHPREIAGLGLSQHLRGTVTRGKFPIIFGQSVRWRRVRQRHTANKLVNAASTWRPNQRLNDETHQTGNHFRPDRRSR